MLPKITVKHCNIDFSSRILLVSSEIAVCFLKKQCSNNAPDHTLLKDWLVHGCTDPSAIFTMWALDEKMTTVLVLWVLK